MGKVWLVGAGPSDVGLLTIRGREILLQADTVVYDRLVGQGILNLIPEGAECIDVGKRAGNHTMPQEEINQVLLEKALEGKRVVRLKGGDPFLFGRGGEELELLSRHGIPFEVVPGVTSAISVPAYNGIPVTHRDAASSLHIITGHKKKGEPYDIDFEALVRTKGTLVFLMGYSALGEICRGLLCAGIDPEMPACLLQQGTTAGQKRLLATVSTLEAEAAKQRAETPAIILVGKVCEYAHEFSWYEKLPLFGHRIIVTRPKERSGLLSGRLRELGAEVLELPAIRTVPLTEHPAFFEELKRLPEYDYLVFTSPAGVNIFFDALHANKKDIRSIGSGVIAAIGPGTEKELEKRGLFAELMPSVYDGQSLGILLGETCKDGDKILIPRAKTGNPELVEELTRRRKVEVVDLPLYDTKYGPQDAGYSPQEAGYSLPEAEKHSGSLHRPLPDQKALIEAGKISMAVFTSASTVRGFAACTAGLDYGLVRALCIGRQTKAAADALGMRTCMAKEATIDSLVELAVETASCGLKR